VLIALSLCQGQLLFIFHLAEIVPKKAEVARVSERAANFVELT
jgi:hypothetical protein